MDLPNNSGQIFLFNKPIGWTSFDLVRKVKNTLKMKKKVGHAGTLDPLATGLLIICTERKTKEIESIQALPKEYTGTFVLGASTPCFDLEKEVNQTKDISDITEEKIYNAVKSFLGDQMQVPPMFSAVKVNGERAYNLAREGAEVELKPKPITIYEFEINSIQLPEIHFRVRCSKGTYIRSLARDFALALDNIAYLTNLKRTAIGHYRIEDAYEVDKFVQEFTGGLK